jgi:hypothetical protein
VIRSLWRAPAYCAGDPQVAAQQRADRFQLRARYGELAGGRQAPAFEHGADDRSEGWQATIITTVLQLLLERLDLGGTLPQAIAATRISQRNSSTTQVEPAFFGSPELAALTARGEVFSSTPETGAATGIEFLSGGLVLAAAEPVRRGRRERDGRESDLGVARQGRSLPGGAGNYRNLT